MDISVLYPFMPNIINGLWVTVYITLASVLIGCVLGILMSFGISERQNQFLKMFTTGAIEIIRAVPPLVWLIWVYFVLPLLLGIRLDAISSSIIVFTAIFAAFAADIFRGAATSIPKDTIDSYRALGFTETQINQHLVVPEIIRRSFAALNGQTIGMLKMSSLASVIAVPELTYVFQIIVTRKPLPIEIYSGMALAYCLLIFPVVLLLRYLEGLEAFKMQPRSND